MMFVISKILWIFLSPSSVLILLLLIGAFLGVSHSESSHIAGRRICFVVAMLFFLIAIFPVGEWMLVPLENRFPSARPDHVDGIILVGEDENTEVATARGQAASNLAADDYIAFVALARQYPQAKLVYTGGSGLITPDSELSNAAVARRAFAALGLPVEHIVFEDKSRTTHENAVATAALVHPEKTQTWLLVTSAMHMPRSIACFRKQGFDVYPAPASYMTDGKYSTKLRFTLGPHLTQMTAALHEYLGLVAYKLQGYTDKVWPK